MVGEGGSFGKGLDPKLPRRDNLAITPDMFYRPLFPEDRDQGDPYVLATNSGFYVYVTGEHEDGKAIPAYKTHDFKTFESLGGVFESGTNRSHWAPCVQYVEGLDYPYVGLLSRGKGLGEEGHIGHELTRFHSKSPEGPFTESGHVLTPDRPFSIDADVFTDAQGRRQLAFATDFFDEPLGTGVAVAEINEDLTQIGPIHTTMRATGEWQVYENPRTLSWHGLKDVKWHTVEAPVGGLVSPKGRDVILYSGGPYWGDYAVSALVKGDDGMWEDVSTSRDHFVLKSRPDKNIIAPGHPSLLITASGLYLMTHLRTQKDAPRQMAIAPLYWNEEDLPYCPSL